jgi:hypothetical protein
MRSLMLSLCLSASLVAVADTKPQAQEALPAMLSIDWSTGVHLPQGMQDNAVGLAGDWLLSVGGFCSGADDDWKPGIYPRGFLDKAWGLNLEHTNLGWQTLPSLPAAARQGMLTTTVGEALYVWGGFSYTEPYTYADGYRLSRKNGDWDWTSMPPLPSPAAWAGVCAIGSNIYALGGTDYDAQRFYTLNNRSGDVQRLGARLLVLDTKKPNAGWKAVASLPGTPRALTSVAVVNSNIYVIGGIGVLENGGYANVVDNWRYDPAADTWKRLRDCPISATGGSSDRIVFDDRYVLLPSGYQYGVVQRPDGTSAEHYGTPHKVERLWKQHPTFETTHYYNHVFVYDTKTNLFGTATHLPMDDVASITVIKGDTAYIFPGETGGFEWKDEYFGHHPEFVLKGTLKELKWSATEPPPSESP